MLITGLSMSREEFLRTWENTPELRQAEFIDGIVHVPPPVPPANAEFDFLIHHWLAAYCDYDRRCKGGANATWLMLESAPQPDSHLRLLPEFGGQSKEQQGKFIGAPELAVEICETSREVDFGPKLALYQRAGVREYITVETLLPDRKSVV